VDVTGWHQRLLEETSSASAMQSLRSLRNALYWAQRNGILDRNPAANLRIVHVSEPGDPLSDEEFRRLHVALDVLEAHLVERSSRFRNRPHATLGAASACRVLKMLGWTGGRVDEFAGARVAELRLGRAHLFRRATKGGPRAIPLGPEAVQFLEEQVRAVGRLEFLFPSLLCPSSPVGVSTVQKTMTRACHEAGIRRRSPHDLRHTFVHFALASGVDLDSLAQALGHADSRTTRAVYGRGCVLTPRALNATRVTEAALRGEVGDV
jgi:integrase